jgi:hypothetical protein
MKTFKIGNLTFHKDETGQLKEAFEAGHKAMVKASIKREKQWKKFLKSKAAKRRF